MDRRTVAVGTIIVVTIALFATWSCTHEATEKVDGWEEALHEVPGESIRGLFRAGSWQAAREKARESLRGHEPLPPDALVTRYITPPLHPLRYQASVVAALVYAREIHKALLEAVKNDRIIGDGRLEAHLLLAGVSSLHNGCQEALALLRSSRRRTRLVGHVLMQLLTYRSVPPRAYAIWSDDPAPDVPPSVVSQWESYVMGRESWSAAALFRDATSDLSQRWTGGGKAVGTDPSLQRLIAHVSQQYPSTLDVIRATRAGVSFDDLAADVDLQSYLDSNSLVYWLIP